MYRPRQYSIDDTPTLHRAIRQYPFATIAVSSGQEIQFAYAPVVLDERSGRLGGVRFHLARANPFAELTARPCAFIFRGPDAYVSPDWYRSRSMVPTWNYVAVEGRGVLSTLTEMDLRTLLADLSAQEETRLVPKPAWTLGKLSEEQLNRLERAIVGFSVCFNSLEGKYKLSQDKADEDFNGVIAGLEGRSNAASLELAMTMKLVRCKDGVG